VKIILLVVPLLLVISLFLLHDYYSFRQSPLTFLYENAEKYEFTHERTDCQINLKNNESIKVNDLEISVPSDINIYNNTIEFDIAIEQFLSIGKGSLFDIDGIIAYSEDFAKEGSQYVLINGNAYDCKIVGRGGESPYANGLSIGYRASLNEGESIEIYEDTEITLVLENYVYTTYVRK